ncbi:ribosomal protein L10 (nucleomorph) [Bigelowiella natans]|uniref:Ribosomal protein L10 n=1 Tax=Bigelowiella natans TaxID=227086 RepID=Q3LWA7_BIGNA|nr:ribosomal protein L10 [Bigelowiella natans]ABA27259.1 ribosomal protein L10 [Bigelowiella natans]|mmetsp:Transcript_23173/g.32263  ORF Transcript_23173/g.32263 Transcript_23173/m.32263 type:complete len:252 (-) Transcript_23173:1349-2104(-)
MRSNRKKVAQKFISLLNSYDTMVIVNMNNIRSKQIHDIRKHLRGTSEIVVGKKSFLSYLLQNNKLEMSRWMSVKEYLSDNIGLIFTNSNLKILNETFKQYFLTSFVNAGEIAQRNIIIKKGIKNLSPSQTPFFQALGIPTRISKSSIEIIEDILLVSKNQALNKSQEVLLKKLDIKPHKYGVKIKKIFSSKGEINLKILQMNNNNLTTNTGFLLKQFLKHSCFNGLSCSMWKNYNILSCSSTMLRIIASFY